ncbi:MAG: hypothetical protein QOD89_2526 [Bradyrhizobium sp.]|nr:hypothetical protein [Bradyrhizobium sp.]
MAIYVYMLRCADNSYYIEARPAMICSRELISTILELFRATRFTAVLSFWSGPNASIG